MKILQVSPPILLLISVQLFFGRGIHARNFSAFEEGRRFESQSAGAIEPERIYESKDVDEKVKILKKPEPGYTKESQERAIEGSVLLKALFSSNAKVTNITVLKELPAGLTKKAIEAARKIKFKPAMKEGRPVSVYLQVEYYFRQY